MTATHVTARRPYWRERGGRNARVAAIAGFVIAAAYACNADDRGRLHQLSLATAYASTVLLAWALMLGSWSLWRGRRPPTSTDLRRDVGVWSAILAVVHTVVGLRVHLKGDMVAYFSRRLDSTHVVVPRLDLFGAANDTGMVATIFLVLLTVISNDRALRTLGAGRWKQLQRWTYPAAALVAIHGLVYQGIERRAGSAVAALLVIIGGVVTLQLDGRRRYAAVVARVHGRSIS